MATEVMTKRQLLFGREPAFWTGAIAASVSALAAFGFKLSTEQQGAIVAVASALMGAVLAYQVRPIAVPAFTAVLQTAIALMVAFGGMDLTIEQQGVILTVSAVFLNLFLVRPQVEPSKGWFLDELLSTAGKHREQ